MNKEYITNALSEIEDKYIAESCSICDKSRTSFFKKHKKSILYGIALAIAALFTILFIKNTMIFPYTVNKPEKNDTTETKYAQSPTTTPASNKEGVYIPQSKLSLVERDDVCYSWVGPIAIYNGRSYIGLGILEDVDHALLEEHLGTCTGLIKEWSDPYEYVDFSGNIEGELYAIKGYDTDFMIGLKTTFEDSPDSISALINGNDITLTTGADIYEKRLHLAGNYDKVTYQSREDWYESNGNIKTFDKASSDILSDFVNSLNKGKVMLTDEIPLEDKDSSIFDEKELCHLVFYKKDGIAIELRCMEGGYVFFDGIRQVCVKMSEKSFNQVCYAFDK